MTVRRSRASLALWIAFAAAPFQYGQDPAAAQNVRSSPGGSVNGDVYDDATNLPVRFALVRLVPVPADLDAATFTALPKANDLPQAPALTSVEGASAMDGSFQLKSVPAGEYFIAGLQLGYVLPGALTIADLTSTPEQLKNTAESLPRVRVVTGGGVQVHLRLRRGGAIAGRVVFADASPAVGIAIACEPAKLMVLPPEARFRTVSPLQVSLQGLVSMQVPRREFVTDDQGDYRVFGLAPGKYVVSTMLGLDHTAGHATYSGGGGATTKGREHMYPEMITVYQPGVFSRERAKVFEVQRGELVSGADFSIAPQGLHSVRGKVLSAADGHVPTGVMVSMKPEGSNDPGRFVEVEEDGSFELNFVPPGRYAMAVMASDRPDQANASTGEPEPITFYRVVRLPVVVGEQNLALETIRLTALKAGQPPEDWSF